MIVLLKPHDLPELARVHKLIFPGSRSSQLGYLYIKKMFQWFHLNHPGLCFVIKDSEKISGYVVGSIGGYGRSLFRFALIEITIGLILHPRIWFKKKTYTLWRSYLKGLCPKKKNGCAPKSSGPPSKKTAALAGIGVLPEVRGKGMGQALVQAFEEAARNRQVQKLTLSVQLENKDARSLYENCGWKIDKIDLAEGSVHYFKEIL